MPEDTLNVIRTTRDDETRPIVLLHGFTQNARCWGQFGKELSLLGPSVVFDLPGHGNSSAIRADLTQSALLIAAELDANSPGKSVTVVGYSLGGRTALHLALIRPDLVNSLVLIGATGGIDDAHEREARRAADEKLAHHLETVGLRAFLEEWLAQPLFATLNRDAADFETRLANTESGLSSSLRLCGTGTQEPLWERLHELMMPVLLLAGALDEKFCLLGERLEQTIGTNATFKMIDGAGHSAHLEQPETTFQIVSSWLASIDQ